MRKNKEFKTLVILVLVACLAGFTSDIYAPSFLTMVRDLKTTLTDIQQSMGIFMFSLAIAQLIYGPLSEVIGRRISLLIGLTVMMAGSLICIFTENFANLMIGRFIQGLGAGACACLWRSIFRDIFNSQQIAKYGGYLGIAMVYVVAASPFLGGYIEAYSTWRTAFSVVLIYGSIVFLLVYFILPETNIHHTKARLNLKFFSHAYGQLLKSPLFMGYSLCVFFTYGAFFSWFVVGPVLCMVHFNLSPENFGWINLTLGGTAMALGGMFNGRYVERFGQNMMLRLGWSIMIFSGLIILIIDLASFKILHLFLMCVFTFLFGATLIWPNAFSKAFAPFGNIAGYAGSLYGSMQLGGGSAIGLISAFIPYDRPYPLAVVFIATALSAWLLFECLILQKIPKYR
jgi:DHA1 family bicyclomycin/chloramphenicol resistance-like MFS transporter/DHA1 family 2-module integral membrane pump EmrD-like MFS transporter